MNDRGFGPSGGSHQHWHDGVRVDPVIDIARIGLALYATIDATVLMRKAAER